MRFIKGGKYTYRNLSMADSPDGWHVGGCDDFENSAGILEWCYDRSDAMDRLNRMQQTGEFSQLVAAVKAGEAEYRRRHGR